MSEKEKREKAAQRLSRAMIARTLFLLALCGVTAFAVLAVRLYRVQVDNSDHFESVALGNQLKQTTLTASRGTIFDANGKILAVSAAVENVFISPYDIERNDQSLDQIADGLAGILGVPRQLIVEKASNTASQYQVIKYRVEGDEAGMVRDFIKENSITGVYLEPTTRRYYPNDSLASQIIGFVGADNTGLYGLEQQYNGLLTGANGRVIRLKNAPAFR